jgi:hypothetical protein
MILALTLAVALGAIGLVANDTDTSRFPVVPAAVASEPVAEIPMLATIRVEAHEEIPTLPLVVVRPGNDARDEIESAARPHAAVASSSSASNDLPDVLPHVRLDMPYYSFGKLTPRAIKD